MKNPSSCDDTEIRTHAQRQKISKLPTEPPGGKKSGLVTVYCFCSVQMVTVSKNHMFKWFVVMVFTLSWLKMDGSRETRFAAVWFTVPGQV